MDLYGLQSILTDSQRNTGMKNSRILQYITKKFKQAAPQGKNVPVWIMLVFQRVNDMTHDTQDCQ